MSAFEQLRDRTARLARIHPPSRAERWIRSAASVLAEWGDDSVRSTLRDTLPAEALRGAGSSGKSWDDARREARLGGEDVVLREELARRVVEPDPAKVGLTLHVVWGLFKESMNPAQVEAVAAGLPEPVAEDWRQASTSPPWRYRLIPQSYRRPDRIRIGHHH